MVRIAGYSHLSLTFCGCSMDIILIPGKKKTMIPGGRALKVGSDTVLLSGFFSLACDLRCVLC